MNQPHADRPPSLARHLPKSPQRSIPRYRLILHSGVVADLMFIVRTIMELTRFCLAEATHKMWQAHHFGRSQLLVTYRERAELYVEQFAARGLTVTIEPA